MVDPTKIKEVENAVKDEKAAQETLEEAENAAAAVKGGRRRRKSRGLKFF